jgi:hypothetical protein
MGGIRSSSFQDQAPEWRARIVPHLVQKHVSMWRGTTGRQAVSPRSMDVAQSRQLVDERRIRNGWTVGRMVSHLCSDGDGGAGMPVGQPL